MPAFERDISGIITRRASLSRLLFRRWGFGVALGDGTRHVSTQSLVLVLFVITMDASFSCEHEGLFVVGHVASYYGKHCRSGRKGVGTCLNLY